MQRYARDCASTVDVTKFRSITVTAQGIETDMAHAQDPLLKLLLPDVTLISKMRSSIQV